MMDDKTQARIAANIAYLRRLFGYTQANLAKAIHMGRGVYAQMETGETPPTTDTLMLLADFYHISVDTILQLDTKKIMRDVMFSDRYSKQIHILLDIYNQLSPVRQKQLMTRAKQLSLEEEIGEVPSLCTVL